MTKKQHDAWLAERAKRAPVVLKKADDLQRQADPDPLAVWAMDGCLRCVLQDTDWYWVRWCFFREQQGVEPNYAVVEGWTPDE